MDDFSWGSTRKVEGEGKLGGHGDKEGVFDSHAISMKRWSEWERERRYKAGTRSHESPFESIQRTDSPQYSTNRNSIISSAETFVSQGGHPQDPFYRAATSPGGYSTPSPNLGGRRVDSVQILELPAPLSATPQNQPYQHIPSSTNVYETADPGSLHNYEASPYQSSSSENIHQTNAGPGDD
jgi:chitin synthase